MSPLIVARLVAPAAMGAPVGQAAAGAAVVATLEPGATVVGVGVVAVVVAGSVVLALSVVVDAAIDVDVAADSVVADEEPSSVQPAAMSNANAATVACRVIGRLLLIVPPRLVGILARRRTRSREHPRRLLPCGRACDRNGPSCQSLQATGLCLPVGRDLRRLPQHV